MSGSLASVSNANAVSSAVNGQASGVQGNAAPARRRQVTDLYPVIIGRIYTFLDLENVMAGKLSCKAFHTGFRVWEKQTCTLNAQSHARYLQRNAYFGDAHGSGVDPRIVEETQKAARAMQRLELMSYGLNDLETFFRSPRTEVDMVPLFSAHDLEIDLSFSLSIGRPKRRIRGAQFEEQENPHMQERVDALSERMIFHCPQVTHLSMKNATEELSKRFIAGFPALTSLDCEYVDIKDLTTIPNLCPKLQRLSLKEMCTNDQRVKEAATIPALWELSPGGWTTDDGLAALAHHQNLRGMQLAGCQRITNRGLQSLATIPNLERVIIANCTEITDLSCISRMKSLRSLDVTHVFADSVHSLTSSLAVSKTLENLVVTRCMCLNDGDLEAIARVGGLRRLTLSDPFGGSSITDKGLRALSSCRALQYLTIDTRDERGKHDRSTWQFTTAGFIALVAQLPELRELNLRNCELTNVDADKIEETFYKSRPGLLVVKRDKVEKKEEGKAKA
ncbi:MAG: hypothetical protein ACHQT8_05665 [Chlamydiales bacterium]